MKFLSLKLGKKVLFQPSDVEEFIKTNRKEATLSKNKEGDDKMKYSGRTSDYPRWILVDNPYEFDWDKVIYDGYGYVILKDGARLDVKPDLYKKEREEWNEKHGGHIQDT